MPLAPDLPTETWTLIAKHQDDLKDTARLMCTCPPTSQMTHITDTHSEALQAACQLICEQTAKLFVAGCRCL